MVEGLLTFNDQSKASYTSCGDRERVCVGVDVERVSCAYLPTFIDQQRWTS